MNILVFNCGSSSLTYKIFRVDSPGNITTILTGKAHRVGVKGTEESFIETFYAGETDKKTCPIKDHRDAAGLVLEYLSDKDIRVDHVGHRFVHGGSVFTGTTYVDAKVFEKLESCIPLAPIHNPVSLNVILEVGERLKKIPQYVAFDSAFHSSIPEYAYTYALPIQVITEFGFRKYGFHGLSYSYVTREAARFLGRDPEKLKITACHLGTGGASVAAIRNGRSVDTSMGYSPLPGLIMSTRCGDIDPMLTIYMMVMYGYRPDELMDILNRESGLLGISGASSDIRDILHGIAEEKDQVELAYKMYIHRLKKYVGSYITALEGIDVLVFTDDVGVHNWQVREQICKGMEWSGIILDKDKNRNVTDEKTCIVSSGSSGVGVLTVPTREEYVICLEGLKLIKDEK